jgi:hypothetical protein
VHPIKTTEAIISKDKTIQGVIKEHFAQPLPTQISQTLLSTVGYATALIGGGAIATAAKAGTIKTAVVQGAKSLIPTTTKGRITAAIAAPVVVGAISKQPVASLKFVAKAPGELSQFGGDVASFATNPSLESAKQIIKESPVISAAAGLVIVGGAAKAIIPAIATARQTEAIQEQTEAIKGVSALPAATKEEKAISVMPAQPATLAQTQTISKTSVRVHRKPRIKEKPLNVSQRVNVIVSNNKTEKKYLNTIVLKN